MEKCCVVSTAFANETDANKIINYVLENKIVACAQVININSHYTWKGKICHEPEVLVLFKTTWNLYDTLESIIKEMHPYEIPEITATNIEKGLPSYLDWMVEVTKSV